MRLYREVQLDLTLEIEVFHTLFDTCHTKNRKRSSQNIEVTFTLQNGEMIDPSNNGSANMKQLDTNVLLITDVSHGDAGEYKCSAFNHITNQKKMSRAATTLGIKESSKNEKSRTTYRLLVRRDWVRKLS